MEGRWGTADGFASISFHLVLFSAALVELAQSIPVHSLILSFPSTAFDIQVNGKRGPGRPKMTWKQLTERDRREWKLSAIDPHDRDTWRSGVRSAMRAASQLPGRGPTVVDMAPIPAR